MIETTANMSQLVAQTQFFNKHICGGAAALLSQREVAGLCREGAKDAARGRVSLTDA